MDLSKVKVKRTASNRSITWVADAELTQVQAGDLQELQGFGIPGYGFHGYKVEGGKTHWSCSQSCD
jgi:hypothetical protein